MNELPTPDEIVEVDLRSIAKKGIILTVVPLVFLLVIHYIVEGRVYINFSLYAFLMLFVGYILLIILHEFFHLLGFRVFAKVPWKKMKVGVNFKEGIAYATTDMLMTNRAIRGALLLPFWLTGILPALIGLYTGSGVLIILSALLIGGAVGDFAMYKQLKKSPDHWLIKDDPKLPRLYVFAPETIGQ